MREGQAAVVQGSAPPWLRAASTAPFSSMFEFQQRSLASEAFRYEQWQVASSQLKQDTSLVVRLDFEHISGSDWTLRNTAEQRYSVQEATIVGCAPILVRHLSGVLDEFALFSRALSDEEIHQPYVSGKLQSEPEPIASGR